MEQLNNLYILLNGLVRKGADLEIIYDVKQKIKKLEDGRTKDSTNKHSS